MATGDEDSDSSGSFDLVIDLLVRDGATSWIADMRIPALGIEWKNVYLQGATEEEAVKDAVRVAHDYYQRTRTQANETQN